MPDHNSVIPHAAQPQDVVLLTQQDLKTLFNYDPETGVLTWREGRGRARPGSPVGSTFQAATHHTQYLGTSITLNGVRYRKYVHAIIWCWVHGTWPTMIDHINGNGSDNRLVNLREATKVTNAQNTRRPLSNKTGVMGVFQYPSGRYVSYITVNRKREYLYKGTDFDAAVAARKAAENRYGFHPNHGRGA